MKNFSDTDFEGKPPQASQNAQGFSSPFLNPQKSAAGTSVGKNNHNNNEDFGPEPPSMFDQVNQPPGVSLNAFCIVLFAIVGLFLAGGLFWPISWPAFNASSDQPINYSIQLPLAVALGAILGPMLGIATVGLFLLLALCGLPVLSNGGGVGYLLEPGAGYWLAAIAAAWVLGRQFQTTIEQTYLLGIGLFYRLPLLAMVAMLGVHSLGLLYLGGLVLFGLQAPEAWQHWAMHLSVAPFVYDVLVLSSLLLLARTCRLLLWLPLY